jgi:hypothetical protein
MANDLIVEHVLREGTGRPTRSKIIGGSKPGIGSVFGGENRA